jgi:hypothetical protein
VRFVQRALTSDVEPEANFNDVRAILEFLVGADSTLERVRLRLNSSVHARSCLACRPFAW